MNALVWRASRPSMPHDATNELVTRQVKELQGCASAATPDLAQRTSCTRFHLVGDVPVILSR